MNNEVNFSILKSLVISRRLGRKKGGTTRFCRLRRLNAVTINDAYPLPRIDDSFDHLSGSCWFSTLDLCSGYWQVECEGSDRHKTAFATRSGLYEFRVMPFGLKGAPATFERLLETVLAGLQWDICLIYLDDVLFGLLFETWGQTL
ncbi:MAG: RNA-directed DNA polymerase [Candidatus Thiodubiliella endoseptemdiera]|uniref:RNA-directed DNA polymerase n=1 Tax=Candidatus Thiodubiliella endoseptemdiera TaxID=2738886 RepID=A0A853F820_9GAMM|nr:RNA-directed DNA polymerase [Candidatus Thiodubiliella endoseptemdiera]